MAWILTYYNGAHSALHVKENCRGMGLAKILCKKLMHDRALQGKDSHCHIFIGNTASEKLFLGLGFQRNYEVDFGGKGGLNI